jgi:hypothetical protein
MTMAWSHEIGIGSLLSDVLALQLRLNRLQMLQRIETVRAQALASGIDGRHLKKLQTHLLDYPLPDTGLKIDTNQNTKKLRSLSVESESVT